MEKCIIVAIADNNAIGRDNALLWHISEDLKFFKRTTLGCPVIMGRRTFESIGRPLPKRLNVVISRGFDAPEGVVVVPSFDDAYKAAEQGLPAEAGACSRCFVIGGGQIYAQAMADADRLVVTHVHAVIEDADTFFPAVDPAVWKVESRSEMFHDDESGYDFEFVEYVKQ
jgi:dihydrofolate reductase